MSRAALAADGSSKVTAFFRDDDNFLFVVGSNSTSSVFVLSMMNEMI